MSLVSGVNEQHITNSKVDFTNVPFGGGALTEGANSNNGKIHVFWTKAEKGKVYDTNTKWIFGFLKLMSHEVGHLPQIDKAGSNKMHLLGSFAEYLDNWTDLRDSHDPKFAIKENEAEIGANNFDKFSNFVDLYYGGKEGTDMIGKLFRNKNNTDKDITTKLNKWWNKYQTLKK